jgi:hypothetical protein
VVTGFLMRSTAVRAYPHMDVRAFRASVADDAPRSVLDESALRVLRLERVAPSVLLALFEGVPRLVWIEEPLHGVPVGVVLGPNGFHLHGRPNVAVPFRAGGKRVLHASALRRSLLAAAPALPRDSGSGALAEELLGRAHRQRFEGRGGRPPRDGFDPTVGVADRAAAVAGRVRGLVE